MKNKKTFKEAFGRNPWDPWSAKANLNEDGLLDKYLLSRGLNPKNISKDMKIAHSKSNQFKQWAMNQKEEIEIDDNVLYEAPMAQLHRYLLSRGLDPLHVSKDSKIAHAKSNQFKQWAMNQREEVQNEDHVAIAMGKQLDDEGSMALSQLDTLEDAIAKLRNVIKDPKMQLPAWVQSKITLATDHLDTVADYMSSKTENDVSKYCPGCKKMEKRSECGFGTEYFDKYAQDRANEEVELNEGLIKKVVAAAALAAAAASPHAHAQDKEPTQHPSNPHLVAHVEHEGKVHRFDLEKMFKSHEDAANHMTKSLNKHGIQNHLMHITNKHKEHELPTYAAKHKDYMDKTPAVQKVSHSDYSDNKPYVAKHSDKNYMSTESVSDKLNQRHQELRKKSGLPNPSYYKELGKSYDISDDKERLEKQSEIKKKYNVESVLYDDPKGTLTRVAERKKELSRSARIIKALYKKKGVKEDTYDWEKDDKDTSSYGKQPKYTKSGDKASKVKKESDAAAVLSGGTTLTKQKRDIVELDPRMKLRSNKDAQDANDNNTNQ